MSNDLVIEGRMLDEGGLSPYYLCIKDGIITRVSKVPPGHEDRVKGYGRSILFPGCIDSHVHFRDPGLTQKEDFATGSMSAAFGGVTTVLDMPNTIPPTLDQRCILEKDAIAKQRSFVDYGLYLGVTPDSRPDIALDGLRSIERAPLPLGIKAFLGESTGSLVFKPIEKLSHIVGIAVRNHLPLAVHAEDGDLIIPNEGFEGKGDRGSLSRHMRSRPQEVETSAIERTLAAAGANDRAIHFLHISSKGGIDRAQGSGASIEVTPHHLLLDIKWCQDNLEQEVLAKVNPPIRNVEDRAALWEAVLSGRVTCIGSDHAPHMLAEKEVSDHPPSGLPGTETMLPLLMYEFMSRKLDLRILQRLLTEGPARRFGIVTKGSLAVGQIADIVVMDHKDVRKVRGEDLHSKCGWTPFEGFKAIFPKVVYSRGELLVEDGNICCRPGRGKNLSIPS